MSGNAEPLTIDVVSDVVCPWCFLGKKRLETALRESGENVVVRWRPFQLDPSIPAHGVDRVAYMRNKFGDTGRIEAAHERLRALGAADGIAFAFDRIARAPNTLDAHRLIRWAYGAGVQDRVVDRLFERYFVEGRDIGERASLIETASECGMDAELVGKLLDDGSDVDEVREEIAQAQQIGVTGVPFYILGQRFGVSGAQEAATLVEAIGKTREMMREAAHP
jgi:predicted DsbA family dithiol-disulfide isomerase